MADAEIVSDLERVLAQIKARGHQTIEIDDLLRLVEGIKREKEAATQLILQGEEHGHQWDLEMVRSGINAGTNALKTSLLISGGSAAALLAFAGSAWSSLTEAGLATLASMLGWLAWAILSTGVASSVTYLCQYFFAERQPWHEKAGDICQWFASALVALSYVFVFIAYMKASELMMMFKVVKAIPLAYLGGP